MNLPPQAYTRDILAAAFEWLHTQPASVRELATDSDSLVSLFMRAKRRPAGATINNENSTTSSPESFKQDLRTIAEGLKQFDGAKKINITQSEIDLPTTRLSAPNTVQQSQSVAPRSQPLIHNSQMPTIRNSNASPSAAQPEHAPIHSELFFDPKTLDFVRKTQMHFNLSNENEAIRLLISIGFEHIRSVLPKG